ncbi:MAG: hypothetical protein M3137_17420 [Actinomycetota bacterium]|nr:hypothetical protein [Actinomycetota bacterium]
MSTVLTRPASLRRFAAVASTAAVLVMGVTTPAFAANPIISQATAQAVNLNLLNGTANLALSNPPTKSVNTGAPPSINTRNAAALSLLNGDNFLTAGALSEDTEADTGGISFACAGTVAPGGTVEVGTQHPNCTRTGNGAGGLTIDLSQVPGLGAPLSGLADVTLNLNGVTAQASEKPGSGATEVDTGSGGVTSGSVTVTLAGVTIVNKQPLNIPATANSNLLTSVVNGLTTFLGANPTSALTLQPLIDALSTGVRPLLELCTNYQPSLQSGGSADCRGAGAMAVPVTPTNPFSVSGIHLSLLNKAGAVADISKVTVGPNAIVPAGPAFPREGLPIAAGGGLLAVALIVPWYRRRRRNMSSVA